jgi:hypothetical protein
MSKLQRSNVYNLSSVINNYTIPSVVFDNYLLSYCEMWIVDDKTYFLYGDVKCFDAWFWASLRKEQDF